METLAAYPDMNWDTSWLDINSIEADNVSYFNGEIPRLEHSEDLGNNPKTQSTLRQYTEQRSEILECMEARSRLLSRNTTNPASVTPPLSNRIWRVIYLDMWIDIRVERSEGIADCVRESLEGRTPSFPEGHNYTRSEIRNELRTQVSEVDWSDSLNRLFNNR